MSRVPAVLSVAVLVFSLALVAISVAVLYLTAYGIQRTKDAVPAGRYIWYRGPSWDIDNKPEITLQYDPANEGVILAAAATGVLTGLTSAVGYFFTREVRLKLSLLLET